MFLHAALFDMDGTLIDSERTIMSAWLEAAKEIGVPMDRSDYMRVIGLNEEDSNELLTSMLGDEVVFLKVRAAAKSRLQAPADRVVFPLKPGVRALLSSLHLQGVPCAVASSSTAWEIEDRLRRTGIRPFFQATAGGDEVPRGKPDPAVYLLAASRLGVDPKRCVAFEDSEYGAAAALAAGAHVILVPDMKVPKVELFASVHLVLKSLDDAMPLVPTIFSARSLSRDLESIFRTLP